MNSSFKNERTPRRSMRLQKIRQSTPDVNPIIMGPRAFAALNKSMNNKIKDQLPSIIVTEAETPTSTQKRRGRKKSTTSTSTVESSISTPYKEESTLKNETVASTQETNEDVTSAPKEITNKEIVSQNEKKIEEYNEAEKYEHKEETNDVKEEKEEKKEEDVIEDAEKEEGVENKDGAIEDEEKKEDAIGDIEKKEDAIEDKKLEIREEKIVNITPQLMDESIISVPETPPPTSAAVTPAVPKTEVATVQSTGPLEIKNVTFSPEVDTSINDSRPHIDSACIALNITPQFHRNKPQRTSTPLAQRLLKRETPKLSAPTLSALAKVLSPKVTNDGKITEESLSETLNGQFKVANPLEKSILKSSRRKRSLSVADGESFMQKKVFFVSPEVMDIDKIDSKMLQSFREEKEISIVKQNEKGTKRHKRSLSVSDSPSAKVKSKMPNFKAIHEQQFRKMESIVDHANRKAGRAMRLITPTKTLIPIAEKTDQKVEKPQHLSSRIPKAVERKPLTKVPSRDNVSAQKTSSDKPKRNIPRANSVDIAKKSVALVKVNSLKNENTVGGKTILPKASASDSGLKTKVVIDFSSGANSSKTTSKVEDRRERNMSLYKGNAVKAGLDHRKRTETSIKGVRLNRRFELQMKMRGTSTNND